MMFSGVICPPIHSIVVVTSPIGGPGAAGIGGDDDDAGEQQAVVAPGDQPLDQRDHDDGGGQIVQDRAEEEGHEADQPHQARPGSSC